MLDALARLRLPAPRAAWSSAAVVVLRRRRRARRAAVADRLDPYGADDPATESVKADNLLEDAGYRDTGVIVLVEDVDVADAADASSGSRRSSAQLRATPRRRLGQPATTTPARAPSSPRDGDADLPRGRPEADRRQGSARTRRERIADRARRRARRHGRRAARSPRSRSTSRSSPTCARAELLAFPLLFLLSLLFFRSLVAALLPLLVGGLAIVGTFLMLRVASELGSISIFALNLITGLGLGLAIDYSLFIVSRYREEIATQRARARRRCGGRWPPPGAPCCLSSLTVAGGARLAARLPAALPLLDGDRRLAGRADRRRRSRWSSCRPSSPARRAGQRARARVPAAPRRARRAPGTERASGTGSRGS